MPNAAPKAFISLASIFGYARPSGAVTYRPILSPLIAPSFTASPNSAAPEPLAEPAAPNAVLATTTTAENERSPIADEAVAGDTAALGAELRCFRARLADAFDAAAQRITADFAVAVLGRELALRPVEIEAIATRVLSDFWQAEPLRLRVSAFDPPVATGDLPVVVDPALRAGDCAIDLADGFHDASLGIRLAAILERACSQ